MEVRSLTGVGAETAVRTEPLSELTISRPRGRGLCFRRRAVPGHPPLFLQGGAGGVVTVGWRDHRPTTRDQQRSTACSSDALSNLSHEDRRFPPPPEFAAHAIAKADLYDEASERPAGLLGPAGPPARTGTREWDQTLDWNPPFAKWFVGGRLNVAVNCVDRHVEAGNGDKVAFHWQGEPGRRQAHDHLRRPAEAGLPGGERPDRARRQGRRPGRRSTCR